MPGLPVSPFESLCTLGLPCWWWTGFPESDKAALEEVIDGLFVDRSAPPRRQNPCSYKFVQCNLRGSYAITFHDSDYSLGGSLAGALGRCLGLVALDLAGRGLVGTVPSGAGARGRACAGR